MVFDASSSVWSSYILTERRGRLFKRLISFRLTFRASRCWWWGFETSRHTGSCVAGRITELAKGIAHHGFYIGALL